MLSGISILVFPVELVVLPVVVALFVLAWRRPNFVFTAQLWLVPLILAIPAALLAANIRGELFCWFSCPYVEPVIALIVRASIGGVMALLVAAAFLARRRPRTAWWLHILGLIGTVALVLYDPDKASEPYIFYTDYQSPAFEFVMVDLSTAPELKATLLILGLLVALVGLSGRTVGKDRFGQSSGNTQS